MAQTKLGELGVSQLHQAEAAQARLDRTLKELEAEERAAREAHRLPKAPRPKADRERRLDGSSRKGDWVGVGLVGRPRREGVDRRRILTATTLSGDERARVERAARMVQMTLSAFLRQCVLDAANGIVGAIEGAE